MTPVDSRRVGIVVPAYNSSAFLGRAIQSIVHQTWTDWRLVIVDDGSSDATLSVALSFASPRVTVLTQQNRGAGAARNLGASALVDCDLLAFLDADDSWHPTYLETQVAALRRHPEAAASVTDWVDMDVKARSRTGPTWTGLGARLQHDSFSRTKALVDALHSSATVIRTSVFTSYGGFYGKTGVNYGEDSWLWAKLVLDSRPLHFSSEKLINFYSDNSALSIGRVGSYPLAPCLIDWPTFLAGLGAESRREGISYLRSYAIFAAKRARREKDWAGMIQALATRAALVLHERANSHG